MKTPLFQNLAVAIFSLCYLLCAQIAVGQEYYDQTNTPRQYYYNNFESATANSPATFFPSCGSLRPAASAIDLAASTIYNGGSKSLATTGSSTLGYISWNFLSSTGAATNIDLNTAPCEWEFDYRNTTGKYTYNPDSVLTTGGSGSCGMVAGKDSWKYWLMAGAYAGNSTLGIYVTQAGGMLKVVNKYSAASNGAQTLFSMSMPNSTDTYQIRIVRSVSGYFNFFILDRTTGVTTTSLDIANYGSGVNMNITAARYYTISYLEATSAAADRFEWDNFNFYQVKMDYFPVTDNGVSSPIYPGMGTAIIYGVNLSVRGDVMIGRLVFNYTGDITKLYNANATLYEKTTLPLSITGATSLKAYTLQNNGTTNQVDLSSLNKRYYSGGNTDGTTGNVSYYFLAATALNPFTAGYPTSVSYSVSNTNNDNFTQFFNSVAPYSSSSASSSSTPVATGDVWDWQGAASWTTAGAWKKNGGSSTGSPSTTTDIVRIGVINYAANTEPVLSGNTTVGSIEIGNLGSTSTTTDPVTIDFNGNNLTVNSGIKIDANATLQLNNSYTSTTSPFGKQNTFTIAGTSTIASTGTLLWPSASSSVALTNSGTLTLQSDISGSASIGSMVLSNTSIAGNSVGGTGTINVQRYLTGNSANSRGYRLLSSAVSTTAANGNLVLPNLTYINSSSFTTGTGGTGGGFSAASSLGPTLYFYRENIAPSNASFTAGNYRGVKKINNTTASTFSFDGGDADASLPAGNGFMFFFRGGTGTVNPYVTTTKAKPATLSNSGNLNQGDIAVKLWFTPTSTNLSYTNTGIANSTVRGFNLVGNPYACSIDWDLVYNDNNPSNSATGLSKTIYIYNPVKKTYASYVAGTANGVGSNFNGTSNANIIPSGQGFFVLAHATNNSLTFKESHKSTAQVTTNLSLSANSALAPKYMRVELYKDSLNNEEGLILFKSASNPGYVFDQDVKYLKGNSLVNFSTRSSDNVDLAINETSLPQTKQIIPLNVNITSNGTYQLKLTELKNIPAAYNIWLKDAYKKDSLDVKANQVYSFVASTADTNTYGRSRFSLVISPNPALAVHLLNFNATKSTSNVNINWQVENEGDYTTYVLERSIDGGKTFKIIDSLTSAGLGIYKDLDTSPILGDNYYRLKQIDVTGSVSYSNVVKVMYANAANTILANSNISVYPNPAQSVLNLAVTNPKKLSASNQDSNLYKITITNAMGSVVKTATAAGAGWQGQVDNLMPGTYFVQVTNSSDNSLTGQSTFIKL